MHLENINLTVTTAMTFWGYARQAESRKSKQWLFTSWEFTSYIQQTSRRGLCSTSEFTEYELEFRTGKKEENEVWEELGVTMRTKKLIHQVWFKKKTQIKGSWITTSGQKVSDSEVALNDDNWINRSSRKVADDEWRWKSPELVKCSSNVAFLVWFEFNCYFNL